MIKPNGSRRSQELLVDESVDSLILSVDPLQLIQRTLSVMFSDEENPRNFLKSLVENIIKPAIREDIISRIGVFENAREENALLRKAPNERFYHQFSGYGPNTNPPRKCMYYSDTHLAGTDKHGRIICTVPEYGFPYAFAIGETYVIAFGKQDQDSSFSADYISDLREVAAIIGMAMLNKQGLSVVRKRATTDALTGAGNNFEYLDQIQQAAVDILDECISYLAVCVVDLDNLKAINDTMSHHAGNLALIHIVDCCRRLLPCAKIYRHGGDEFIIVMKDRRDPKYSLELLRESIADQELACDGECFTVTVSIGYSVVANDSQLIRDLSNGQLDKFQVAQEIVDSIYCAADKGAYRAKGRGRNRVVERYIGQADTGCELAVS